VILFKLLKSNLFILIFKVLLQAAELFWLVKCFYLLAGLHQEYPLIQASLIFLATFSKVEIVHSLIEALKFIFH
jgi:hypothetical protein